MKYINSLARSQWEEVTTRRKNAGTSPPLPHPPPSLRYTHTHTHTHKIHYTTLERKTGHRTLNDHTLPFFHTVTSHRNKHLVSMRGVINENNIRPWITKPVLSSMGIFVAIAKNTLYGSTLLILCQKSLHLHLCFYPKRLAVHSGNTFFSQYMCSLGIKPITFCAANAML